MDTDSPEQASEGFTVYRLPRSHWHCGLSNFRWVELRPPSLQRIIADFMTKVQEERAPHLVLTGQPGIGKTHLGVAVYRWATTIFGTVQAAWLNVPEFCERVKKSYDSASPDPWDDYVDAQRLVVLDDLFGRELSRHEASQIVYRLIDMAYLNNAAVLVTMNNDIEDLPTRLPGHEISRLLADATVVRVSADQDQRRV